jgi:hypothetical protein
VRRGCALIALGAALAASGCGGDDENPTTATTPAVTTTAPAATITDPTASQTAPPQTSTTGPETVPSTTTTPPDSQTNDQPPPAGSPAERFEQFCDANPQACS